MPIERLRLFYALWADEEACRHVRKLTRSWRSTLPYRWTPPEKLHLTLAFLGDVEAGRVSELYGIGQSLVVPAFEIGLDKLEVWPRSEVLCLTASAIPEPMKCLVEQIAFALETAGFPTEKRAFRPHLTLARRAKQLPESGSGELGLAWKADRWCLAASYPKEPGAPYRVLQGWPLGGDPPA